ncbi:MAG: DUF3667 domain-containing protein [Bacteroidota bacterium]
MRTCPSCGTETDGEYCPTCGEHLVDPERYYAARSLLKRLGEEAFGLDTRLGRTAKLLIAKPGALTAEYLRGARKPYVRPVRLFLLINLVFFVIGDQVGFMPWTLELASGRAAFAERVEQRLERTGEDREVFEERFNQIAKQQKRTVLLFLIPAFAGIMAVLYWRRHQSYVAHFVFATHFFVFLLVAFLIILVVFLLIFLLTRLFPALSFLQWFNSDYGLSILMPPMCFAYLYVAMRRTYEDTRWVAAARGVVALVLVLVLTTTVYQRLVFEIALRFA